MDSVTCSISTYSFRQWRLTIKKKEKKRKNVEWEKNSSLILLPDTLFGLFKLLLFFISFLNFSLFLKAEVFQNHTHSFPFPELPSLKSDLKVSALFFSRILNRKIFFLNLWTIIFLSVFLSLLSLAPGWCWRRRIITPGRGSLKLWGINEHLAGWSWYGANPCFNHLDRKWTGWVLKCKGEGRSQPEGRGAGVRRENIWVIIKGS